LEWFNIGEGSEFKPKHPTPKKRTITIKMQNRRSMLGEMDGWISTPKY
jgi:hypothetical protein